MTQAHPPEHEPEQTPTRAPMQAPTTEPLTPTGPIHMVVDLNRCQAYAQCCFLAPDVFRLHGEEALWYDPSPDPGQRERVLRAAAACPVQAITIEASEAVSRPHRKHIEHREKMEEPHAAQRS